MPDDSNGNHSLPNGYLAVTGQKVLPSNHNPPLEDLSASTTLRYCRDGRAPMLGNMPMNGYLINDMGAGVADGDAVTKKQLDDGLSEVTTDLGGAITLNAEKIASKSADYQAVKADNATSFRFTAAATLSFIQADDSDPDVPGLGANWHCEVWAVGGAVTLDPNGSETINGTATLIIQQGQKATVFCTGSAFFAVITSDALSGPHLRGYTFGLALTTNSSDAANDVDIAAGAAASDASPFYLMQLGSALTKRIDASWAVGTNQGGLDTGSVTNATYYIWLIQRSDTLVTDALFSLSNSAPTMPANYDRKRLLGRLVRESGANGVPLVPNAPYTSADLTISSAGTFTLSHGLGAIPSNVALFLVCQVAEQGYSPGDVVAIGYMSISPNFGASITLSNTQIVGRFGSAASPFYVTNKSSGATSNVSNANWKVRIRAWP